MFRQRKTGKEELLIIVDPKQIDVYIVDAHSVAGMTKHPPL